MKRNCLIVDDEALARGLLGSYIAKLPTLHLIGSCKNPLDAMEVLRREQVDLLFLDIQMPDLTGIEFVKTLSQKPQIIFTTAYPQYALEGYQLDITDYLLKPFGFDRFLKAVNKAIEIIELKEKAAHSPSIESSTISQTQKASQTLAQNPNPKTYISVKSDHKLIRLPFEEIDFIQGKGEYVQFHLQEKQILSLMSLKFLEKELPYEQFLRIHKSYIINLKKASVIEGNQIWIGEEALPIGASYKEALLNQFK